MPRELWVQVVASTIPAAVALVGLLVATRRNTQALIDAEERRAKAAIDAENTRHTNSLSLDQQQRKAEYRHNLYLRVETARHNVETALVVARGLFDKPDDLVTKLNGPETQKAFRRLQQRVREFAELLSEISLYGSGRLYRMYLDLLPLLYMLASTPKITDPEADARRLNEWYRNVMGDLHGLQQRMRVELGADD